MAESGVPGLPPPAPPPPPPPVGTTVRSPWWKRKWVIVVAVVVGLVAIGSLVRSPDQDDDDSTTRDASTIAATAAAPESTVTADSTSVTSTPTVVPESTVLIAQVNVDVGDCVESIPESAVIRAVVDAISCGENHRAETFAHEPLSLEGTYPGPQALDDAALQVCETRFLEYVGQSLLQTPFDITWFVPIEESWDNGDRDVTCLILLPIAGTGSVQQIDLSNGWSGYHSVVAVQPGQCFDEAPDLPANVIRLLDCAAPHAFETIGRTTLEAASFPGETLPAEVDAFCRQAFEEYVGISFDASPLEMTTNHPTAESWNRGDRTLLCHVHANGSIGSVAGTGTGGE